MQLICTSGCRVTELLLFSSPAATAILYLKTEALFVISLPKPKPQDESA